MKDIINSIDEETDMSELLNGIRDVYKDENFTASERFTFLHSVLDRLLDIGCFYPFYGYCLDELNDSDNTDHCIINILNDKKHSIEMGSLPFQEERMAVLDDGVVRPVKERKKIVISSAEDFIMEELPEIQFVVKTLISKGLSILSSKPKLGKTWLALDLAVSVALGRNFLGFETEKGGVLYIDLESSKVLLQQRLIKILDGADVPKNLYLANDFSTMNDTFIEDLEEILKEKDISLVIVDVYQKIKKSKNMKKSDYEDTYENLTPLKELAEKYNISLILITHDRKMVDTSDPFANSIGSTAIHGASDQMLSLWKKDRNDKDAFLSVIGRTVGQYQYAIKFDPIKCRWEMLGDAEEIQKKKEREELYNDPIAKTIIRLVDTHGGEYTGKVTDLIRNAPYFNTRIYTNETHTGRKLRKIIPGLKQYFNIDCTYPSKGNASVPYTFKKIT